MAQAEFSARALAVLWRILSELSAFCHSHWFCFAPTVCIDVCDYSAMIVPQGGHRRLAFWSTTVINVPLALCCTSNMPSMCRHFLTSCVRPCVSAVCLIYSVFRLWLYRGHLNFIWADVTESFFFCFSLNWEKNILSPLRHGIICDIVLVHKVHKRSRYMLLLCCNFFRNYWLSIEFR